MPQSPELAAGAGFTFENLVAARYLAALLTEQTMPGVGGIVIGVALQQRDLGEPLDDVIVDFQTAPGVSARLSLQCKAGVTISSAASNASFREIIGDSVKTLQKSDFCDNDRFGAAVGSITASPFRTLTTLCELARDSDTFEHFAKRFLLTGNASAHQKEILDAVSELIAESLGPDFSETFVYRFLRHFVLIHFDYLHEGAVDNAEAINAVRPALRADDAAYAGALWTVLCEISREGAGRSARFSRPNLVTLIGRSIPLAAAMSIKGDLAKLTELATNWVRDIDDDVGGIHIPREKLVEQLSMLLNRERFIQIRGLPGSGKSALLRQRVEADLSKGPVLFLKSDRIEGRSWASFASAVGLSGISLTTLLVEIGAVGTPVLYIDGIDRVEKEHHGVVADVVKTILTDPLLTDWRVVISLRDAGSEPVRTWLPDLFEKARLATVDVGALDNAEARALAEARPELATVLFAKGAVQEIVRRPFFAKVLNQALAGPGSDLAFAPASEVDLIEIWWTRGGFNAIGAGATARQRAIVELASLRVRNLSQPLSLSGMSAPTIAALDELIADGVLQMVRRGHNARFSHDIFFEWALYHRLVDQGSAWVEEIRSAGEPPVISRVVELLSQADFAAIDRGWDATLSALERSGLRSQWTRAWLLGPLAGASFAANRSYYYSVCASDDFRWLAKALVWFQAEKTVPNAAILDGRLVSTHLKRHEIVRLADTFGWPSDFSAWARLLRLLLDEIDDIPVDLTPDIVTIFEVWENALRGRPNAISSELLERVATWLNEIEKYRHGRWDFRRESAPSRWNTQKFNLDDLEDSLRSLILRAGVTRPDLVTAYLSELQVDKHRLDQVFKGVVVYSTFLATTHARQLVDISLLHFQEQLPSARADKEIADFRAQEERLRLAQDKPEEERTEEDDQLIERSFPFLGSSYNMFEWDNLAVDKDMGEYFPASPLREPFHALFESAPGEGLRLIKVLSNHATTAWRELHQLDPQRPRTPIGLELEFPWGKQEFWGNGREYLWARGLWAPKPLAGAYQAMEHWALNQVEAGRPVDAVIEDIVRGNESIAAVGVAVALALKVQRATAATVPLFTSQRLWNYDLQRKVQEPSIASSSLIGFYRPGDRSHVEAIQALNALPFRRQWIRDYVPLFLLAPDEALAKRAQHAIASFGTDLPLEYQEQNTEDIIERLSKDGKFNAEFANMENFKLAIDPTDESRQFLYIDNPQAREPEAQSRLSETLERQQEHLLWFWASQSLEGNSLYSSIDAQAALECARKFDSAKLFKPKGRRAPQDIGIRQGAVAGIAAVVLKYRTLFSGDDIKWARGIISRAARMPEQAHGMWDTLMVIPWHPAISAAKAFGFDFSAGGLDASKQLLRLVAHPLEGVALAALEVCFSLWHLDSKLGWCALWESIALCHISITPINAYARRNDPVFLAASRIGRANEAILHYRNKGTWPDLPAMPVPWVEHIESNAKRDAINLRLVGGQAAKGRWRRPNIEFDWNYGAKVIAAVPVSGVLSEAGVRGRFLSFAQDAVQWVVSKMVPPWADRGRPERHHDIGQFDDAIARLFAKSALMLTTKELEERFLRSVLALENEHCYELLAPFVSLYICSAIYDADFMPENAMDVLRRCLDRVLKDPAFSARTLRDGEMHGYQLPSIVRALLFVSVDGAGGAVRFANGIWVDIDAVLPIVDTLVRDAGFSAPVMSDFLTLVERAIDHYPVEAFADQVLAVLGAGRSTLKGWHGTSLPARIAGLVQTFAFRETPTALGIAQKLLRILDVLVDMGDRRSAALQISDSFREVRIG